MQPQLSPDELSGEVIENSKDQAPAGNKTSLYSLVVGGGTIVVVIVLCFFGLRFAPYIVEIALAQLAQITSGRLVSPAGAILPGTDYILFTSNRDSTNPELDALYLMSGDGSQTIRLTDAETYVSDPEPAPDGRRVVFVADDSAGNLEVNILDLVDRQITQLTHLGTECRHPSWSPDNQRLAFEALDKKTGRFQLYLVNVDGSGLSRPFQAAADTRQPAWSPDGTQIAFVSAGEIELLEVSNGRVARLTENDLEERELVWSPDGGQIVFSTSSPAGSPSHFQLYSIDLETRIQTRLTNTDLLEGSPTWSPDGTRLAFMALSLGEAANIYAMGVDGSNFSQLTDNQARSALPIWSPDGSQIAFTSDMDGDLEIYVMNADGSGRIQLTDNKARDIAWAWLR